MSDARAFMGRSVWRGAVIFLASGALAAAASSDAPPPSANWVAQATEQIGRLEYEFSPQGDDMASAPNRAHDLRSQITSQEISVVSRTKGPEYFELRLRLTGFGRGEQLGPVAPGRLASKHERVEIQRNGLLEWYVNDSQGLEQGFRLNEPPEGEGAVVIEMTLAGTVAAYPDDSGQSIVFRNARGEAVLRYGELKVKDAQGTPAPSHLVVTPGRLRIVIEDQHAVYPLAVDPLLTSPTWTAESNQGGANLGISVVTAGDVNGDGFSDLVVGAHLYDNGESDEGVAFLYLGSAGGLAVDPAWTGESNDSGAQYGMPVAPAGDVNGDGYGDLVVGAKQFHSDGVTAMGRIFSVPRLAFGADRRTLAGAGRRATRRQLRYLRHGRRRER